MSSLVKLSLDDREFFNSRAGKHFLSSCAMEQPLEGSQSLSLKDSINKAIDVIFFLKAYRIGRQSQGVLSVFSRLFSSTSTAEEKRFYEKYSESSVKAFSFEDKASLIQNFIWLMAQAKADGRHEGEFFSALRSMLKFLPVSVAEHFEGLEGRPRPFLIDLNQVKKEFGVEGNAVGSEGVELREGPKHGTLGGAGGGGAAEVDSVGEEDADSTGAHFAGTPPSAPIGSPTAEEKRQSMRSSRFPFSIEALGGAGEGETVLSQGPQGPQEIEMKDLGRKDSDLGLDHS